jgi:hypothetical protein
MRMTRPLAAALLVVGLGATSAMAAPPADRSAVRGPACEAVGGTYSQPGQNANQDRCTVAGAWSTVDLGEPETTYGAAYAVGVPTVAVDAVDSGWVDGLPVKGAVVQVNNSRAKQVVSRWSVTTPSTRTVTTTTTTTTQMERSVTTTQARQDERTVTLYDFHPTTGVLRLISSSTETRAAEAAVTEGTEPVEAHVDVQVVPVPETRSVTVNYLQNPAGIHIVD